MIILFSEEDMLSFGSYMISTNRRKFYEQMSSSNEELQAKLGVVNEEDLASWAYMANKKLSEQNNEEVA